MKVVFKNKKEIHVQVASGEITKISTEDEWILKEFPVWVITGSHSKYVAVERPIKTKYSTVRERVYLHRVITMPKRCQGVDHVDRDRMNNTRANLRFCSTQENMANVGPKNNKKYKGVFQRKEGKLKKPFSSYIAYIDAKSGGLQKRKYLGYFTTDKDAAIAYNKAAKEIYGEFAYQNDVS